MHTTASCLRRTAATAEAISGLTCLRAVKYLTLAGMLACALLRSGHNCMHHLTEQILVQNHKGEYPSGLVAEEAQPYLLALVVPTCRQKLELMLAGNAELRAMHDALQKELNWDEAERGGKLFFLAWDSAPAHTFTLIRHKRATGEQIDRRTIEKGKPGWMQLERCQFIPSAPKVPDCIQEAIEMPLGVGKRAAKKKLHNVPGTERLTWQQMCKHISDAFAGDGVARAARNSWDKALQACVVFSGKRGQWVTMTVRGKKRKIQCTDGGPVPKVLRG